MLNLTFNSSSVLLQTWPIIKDSVIEGIFLFVCLPVAGKIMMRCFLECSTKTDKAVKNFKKRSHWHCCLCPQMFDRISEFRIHLTSHNKSTRSSFQQGQKPGRTDPEMHAHADVQKVKEHKYKVDICTECGKQCSTERALQRHFREVHKKKREGAVTAGKYLVGVCVDFRKGIFMVEVV